MAGTDVGVGTIGTGVGVGTIGTGVGVGLGVGVGVGTIGTGVGVGLGVGVGFGVAVGVGFFSITFLATVVGCTTGTDVAVACAEIFCFEPEPAPKTAAGQIQQSIVAIMSVAHPIPSLDRLR